MTYEEKIEIMLAYLKLKIENEDWHGVADAAMDIRDLEAEKKGRIAAEDEVYYIKKEEEK